MKRVFPLKLHDEGAKVTQAQLYLQKAGSTIKATGIFTIGMLSAVKCFQKKNGLEVTGEIDSATWKKLQAYKTRKIVKIVPKK